jgi:hypothetical protein
MTCIRASIDGFHRPRSTRLRRGELSPEHTVEEEEPPITHLLPQGFDRGFQSIVSNTIRRFGRRSTRQSHSALSGVVPFSGRRTWRAATRRSRKQSRRDRSHGDVGLQRDRKAPSGSKGQRVPEA